MKATQISISKNPPTLPCSSISQHPSSFQLLPHNLHPHFLHLQLLQFPGAHNSLQTNLMASTFAAAAAPTFAVTIPKNSHPLSPTHQTFIGLGSVKPGFPRFTASRSRRPARSVVVRAELNPSVVISLSTGLSLFLGRFVFFNFQRENVAKQVPEQNGVTHFEAGDTRAKEYVGLLKSNDPVGFNIVDVLAWGSIGHIVAYYILATSSNGYDPNFFG